ncbi:hypothetical protein B0T21DRAFT_440449 [Apiosordaria backusii]|uniref:AB hydrolase-1 domain-containing protein n=1 Tax=Apiosordaria backusii TaxID=314023 RepID=A0AA40BL78_9PEZI|nr:hypothetical protein B0T21DRAFT_440449 [Apiosordaria backusii]
MTCRIALLFGALFFALPTTAKNGIVNTTATTVPPALARNCRKVQIPLGNITAANIDFRGTMELVNFTSRADVMDVFETCLDPEIFIDPYDYDIIHPVVEQNVTIHGILCEPELPVSVNERQIHLLVHDLTYDKYMWHGLGLPQYSLADALASGLKGSYTLAIDLWGHGDSHGETYPDPWQVLQPPFHVEVLHAIATKLRQNQHGLWTAFKNVTYVGHGFGAQLGALLVEDYPTDVNVFVGSGLPTANWATPDPSEWRFVPSVSTDPKYARQPLGYFAGEITSSADRKNILYGGLYDPELPELDFVSQDTIAAGEACWGGSFLAPETFPRRLEFKGQTCLLAGEFDRVGCADNAWSVEGAKCKDRLRDLCRYVFRKADCKINVLGSTGHAWMLHKIGIQAVYTIRRWSYRGDSWGNLCTALTRGEVKVPR